MAKNQLIEKNFIEDFDNIYNFVKNDFKNKKEIKNSIRKWIKANVKLNHRHSLIQMKQKKYAATSNKAFANDNLVLMTKYNIKYKKISEDEKLKKLTQDKAQKELQLNSYLKNLEIFQEEYMKLANIIVSKAFNLTKNEEINKFIADYYNTIHSIDIAYEITEKNKDKFSFKKIKKGVTKWNKN